MNASEFLKLVPIPDILKFKKVLFVGPHPDDIEISSGALIKKLVDLNVEVHFLIVTDGGAGSLDPKTSTKKLAQKRKQECIDASNFLKVKSVEVLDFPDGGIYDLKKMVVKIAKKIQNVLPDAVFCPDPLLPTEIHPDHLNCAKATQEAMLVSKFPLSSRRHGIKLKENQKMPRSMSLVYYYTHRPNAIIPVSQADFETKINSILYHKSQIDASFEGMKMYMFYKATSLGKEIGSELAEGYFAMAPYHQHCFLEKIW